MRSSSSGVGARFSFAITLARTVPCPISTAAFVLAGSDSRRAR
jgi:hypothetical protein